MVRRLPLFLLLLLALGLRLGFALSRDASDGSIASLPDQREYLDLGRSLRSGDGLSMADPRFNDVVHAFRMPGYPFLIAATGGSVKAIRTVQSVIDTSTVLAAVWLARRWLATGTSLLAGAFVALDPLAVYFSSLILTETLFAAMLTWGIACLVHGRSPLSAETRGRHAMWGVGVLLLIGSIYVRPSAIAFPTLLVLAAGIAEARRAGFVAARHRWPIVTGVVLLTALALLPWAIRNRTVVDRWIFTTTNDGFTLYDGWNRSADGSSNQANLSALPLLPNLTETQRSDYLRDLAIRDARADPMRLIRLIPIKLGRTWSPWPLSAQFGSNRLYLIAAAAHAIPLFLLAAVALFARATLPRSAKFLLLTPVLVISVLQAISVGSLRYRMPADTSLAVLAAAAVAGRGPGAGAATSARREPVAGVE